MSAISQVQSQDLKTFRRQGFNTCCLMAGSGSLFCTYIGFPSVDGNVRALFRVSSVGFFTFTVIGYSYGYESTSVVKKAAFHLALVFSSGGLGLCGAFWMDCVPRLLLHILSLFTCVFQAVCVSFQLEGSGLLLHTLLTALLPVLGRFGLGERNDVINDSVGAILEQEARILQADDGESGETWAYQIIVAAVCVVVGTVFLAVCKVWHRRHDLRRQETQRVVEQQDVAIGRAADSDRSFCLDESTSDAANPVEAVSDAGSRASPAGSNDDQQTESQTATSLLTAIEPSLLEGGFDAAPNGGEQSQTYFSENTCTTGATHTSTDESVEYTDPGESITVNVTTLSGVPVLQRRMLSDRTVFELKHMVEETSFWPKDLHTFHMDIMLNNTILLNSATLRDVAIVALVSKLKCTVIVKPVVHITCSMSGLGLAPIEEEMNVIASREDPGSFVVSRNNDGTSVRISLPCGRLLAQNGLGQVRLTQAMEPERLLRAIEHERLQLGVDWRLEGYLREEDCEVSIRNVRYGTLLVQKRMPRSPETPHEHDVTSNVGAEGSAAARWAFI